MPIFFSIMGIMWELSCAGCRHSVGLHARMILDGATCRLGELEDVRIDAIQFLEMVVLRIPFNFFHPNCDWVTSHLAHPKYCIGEDIDFGVFDLHVISSNSVIFTQTISVFLDRFFALYNLISCHNLFGNELLLERWHS